ncbi:MAG: OprD family outer membrane porin, partial [Gammaproteobacteria bacterium]
SDEFIPMGEIAGVTGDNSGTTVGGVRFNINDGVSIGAMALRTSDLFTTAYSETNYKHTFNERWGLQLAAQATQQWSIGEQLLGDFKTRAFGFRSALSYQGAVLKLGYTKNHGDFKVRSPFGGRPSFTIGMLYDFDRAGESAWRVGLSQNFAAYGLPGFSAIVNYTNGRNAVADNGIELSDESEIAITADYRPPGNALRGLWLRIRYADGSRGNPLADRRNLRIILNYSLGAL